MKTMVTIIFICCLFIYSSMLSAKTEERNGAVISYRLPAEGTLPRTYRVTLAIVDRKNPNWIISQFASGIVKTVTKENRGHFTEIWNGLDDNFMPVPPSEYAVKGIYMPAKAWSVDGKYHTVVPKFVCGLSSWLPPMELAANKAEPFYGDPCGYPVGDIAVAPDGHAVFYYEYLENGLNNPVFDLNKPIGYEQFICAFPSAGAGGGTSTAFDGKTVWSFSTDFGAKYVYRADGKPFGTGGANENANRNHVYIPQGWVSGMAAEHVESLNQSFVYVAQRGRVIPKGGRTFVESTSAFVDKVSVLTGDDGKVVTELNLERPLGLAVRNGYLYALHSDNKRFAISRTKLNNGIPEPAWQRVLLIPAEIHPAGLAVDSHKLLYISDAGANKIFQFDSSGKVLASFGRLSSQKPGSFDSESFISPTKLGSWTDEQGNDRLLVLESGGPNRISEWSGTGKLLRQFLSLQTKANDGYAIDPDNPEYIYILGHLGWLTRFKVDYEQRTWKIDAVWPSIGTDPRASGLLSPVFLRSNGRCYLAGGAGGHHDAFNIYRFDKSGDLKFSASIFRNRLAALQTQYQYFNWHDVNGDGQIEDFETIPANPPAGIWNGFGQNWGSDMSLLAINLKAADVWRLPVHSFDSFANPIFGEWQRLFSDPIFQSRAANHADAVYGGNELSNTYSSDWSQVDGTANDYFVQARGGHSFNSNHGAQYKLSHYTSDSKGTYQLKWRTGKAALGAVAAPGEIYGAMRIHRPINGLISVIDQTRCGVLLYTEDGLYVDTLFPDERAISKEKAGLYILPEEFFSGTVFPNIHNKKIYIAMGKYTPLLFEAEGWTTDTSSLVHPIQFAQTTVKLQASQIDSPPEVALSLRGGAGQAKIARFSPVLGGAALDGTMLGWESCQPVVFSSGQDCNAEVRCLYDPDHLYLRWHARLGQIFHPDILPPIDQIFLHDQGADTLSFYIQGDLQAKPEKNKLGRPGDVRFVFGLFRNPKQESLEPLGVGFYPYWKGDNGKAQIYRTPVGETRFANVSLIPKAHYGYAIDPDRKGFVMAVEIPRTAIPLLTTNFDQTTKTQVDFSVTYGGHNKFWWANSDGTASTETYDAPSESRLYPGAWAPANFSGLVNGLVIRDWMICGPFGGEGFEKFSRDPHGKMPGTMEDQKTAVMKACNAAVYPPDSADLDMQASFEGRMIQGYWPDPKIVRWRPATVSDINPRVTLGTGAQVWYGATWVYAPSDERLKVTFKSHGETYLNWFINKNLVLSGSTKSIPKMSSSAPQNFCMDKTLTLSRGWNQICFRGYCVGYPPFQAGLALQASVEELRKLKLSATPPTK